MNIAIPLKEVSFLAQASPGDDFSWAPILMIAVLVAAVVLVALMRRGYRSRVNRSDTEIPPGDPLAAARKNESEYARANVRAADQTR